MNELLLDYRTRDLLKKFGAGSHKPGSGSAAAFQGLLSLELTKTVIELTARHQAYEVHLPKLQQMRDRIEGEIQPGLERLLQDDAVEFDKAIKLRQAREKETNPERKWVLARKAVSALVPAIEIPIAIAHYCTELAEFAAFVFKNGFKSVRGDSSVALNGALAAITGCISIVDLNLLSCESDKWTHGVRKQMATLRRSLAELQQEARVCEEKLRVESERRNQFTSEIAAISVVAKGKRGLTDKDIERVAIRLQQALWMYADVYGKKRKPKSPKEILNPDIALELLHFRVEYVPTLGQHEVEGKASEIAGEIDQNKKTVLVSQQFHKPVRTFTTAHELGHALLHRQAVLHRDVPVDGSVRSPDRTERQADRFATHYLMPEKLLTRIFRDMFGVAPYRIDEKSAFALARLGPEELRKKCKNLRGLTKLIASTDTFGGKNIEPIADFFGVSREAMVIRLEELNLVEF